jgi:hypothetical protein
MSCSNEKTILFRTTGPKSNVTFCVVCVFSVQTDEWCVHNRPFNANFQIKFKCNQLTSNLMYRLIKKDCLSWQHN